jgi:hypothetical protein
MTLLSKSVNGKQELSLPGGLNFPPGASGSLDTGFGGKPKGKCAKPLDKLFNTETQKILISNVFYKNKMEKIIQIRAHHLLCIPRFYHGGYDKRFAENMKKICTTIRKDPDIRIKVLVGKTDNLCMRCPHKHKDRCIQSEKIGKWVVLQDMKVAKYLKLKPNSIHTASDVFNLSISKVNGKTIKSICKDCIFLEDCIKVGINNSFRKDLNKN